VGKRSGSREDLVLMNDVADGDDATGSYLKRKHSKSIDVCRLAGGDGPAKDLRRSQPYSGSFSERWDRPHVRSGIYEVKASDTRVACIINQDVGLTTVNMLG